MDSFEALEARRDPASPQMLERSKRWIDHLAVSGAIAGMGGRYSSHGGRSDLADIGQLAAIAVLRTGLNYSLELEIAREEGRALTCAARASSD